MSLAGPQKSQKVSLANASKLEPQGECECEY